jgi:hypothetical protein
MLPGVEKGWNSTVKIILELLKEYSWPVLANFIGAIVVLSGILGSYSLWVDSIDFSIPTWAWWAIFFVSAFYGQFRAFRKVRKERDQLRKFNVTQQALEQVATFRQELVSLQNETIQSEQELGSWLQRFKDFRESIVAYIGEEFSPAEASLFERVGSFDLLTLGNDFDFKHMKMKSQIVRDYKWIEALAIDYGRKKADRDSSD